MINIINKKWDGNTVHFKIEVTDNSSSDIFNKGIYYGNAVIEDGEAILYYIATDNDDTDGIKEVLASRVETVEGFDDCYTVYISNGLTVGETTHFLEEAGLI